MSEQVFELFDGITIKYIEISDSSYTMPCSSHACGAPQTLHLVYCRAGRFVLNDGRDSYCCLEAGDHALYPCAEEITLMILNKSLSAAILSYDIASLEKHSANILCGEALLASLKKTYLDAERAVRVFKHSLRSDALFSAFYSDESRFALEYRRLRALELMLYIAEGESITANENAESYRSEQLEAVHMIHDQLLIHLDRRITIDELSRQYHINPTTLKSSFKAVYGNSIAAHVKEHRMERAEELLRVTDMSISEIAREVGYDSQGKFTVAFKSYYGTLPKDRRKLTKTVEKRDTKKSV